MEEKKVKLENVKSGSLYFRIGWTTDLKLVSNYTFGQHLVKASFTKKKKDSFIRKYIN